MQNRALEISLLLLRVSLFVAMFMWTIDKFVNPGHASGIFESFDGANLLFFAAWPMWVAAITLFLLRDSDRLLSVGR